MRRQREQTRPPNRAKARFDRLLQLLREVQSEGGAIYLLDPSHVVGGKNLVHDVHVNASVCDSCIVCIVIHAANQAAESTKGQI